MNPQASLRIILLISLKSSLALASEYCYFQGLLVNYCPTGKHCCSTRRTECCRNKVRGYSVWGIVFISIFAVALLVAGVYMLYRRLKSRRNPVENGVTTSNIPVVPAFNVQNSVLYPQGQQRIGMVFASYPRQEILVINGQLPPPYPAEDLPPVYPGYPKV